MRNFILELIYVNILFQKAELLRSDITTLRQNLENLEIGLSKCLLSLVKYVKFFTS
jgi:hypothetical protein